MSKKNKIKQVGIYSRNLKCYDYLSWRELECKDNKIGDCTRIISAQTVSKKTHYLIITYNQRFWSHATYHFDKLNDAQDKFKIECKKIKDRKDRIKTLRNRNLLGVR